MCNTAYIFNDNGNANLFFTDSNRVLFLKKICVQNVFLITKLVNL